MPTLGALGTLRREITADAVALDALALADREETPRPGATVLRVRLPLKRPKL
jgi:hypothetical protein